MNSSLLNNNHAVWNAMNHLNYWEPYMFIEADSLGVGSRIEKNYSWTDSRLLTDTGVEVTQESVRNLLVSDCYSLEISVSVMF